MKKSLVALLVGLALLTGCQEGNTEISMTTVRNSINEIPEYSGEPWIEINGNTPVFTEEEITEVSYESYSELDELGRCGIVEACIGEEIMPTEERGKIGMIKPTGWQTVKYDFVDGKYLYNRCHLIGYQLTGENANERNLITGTRHLNIEGMLFFENMVADYVEETGNHVMYRVKPVFDGENLLATGVEMEGYSVEDDGEGIQFHVFCYNIQPGVEIDYETGYSWEADLEGIQITGGDEGKQNYVINTNSMKFHNPECGSVDDMAEHNKKEYYGKRQDLIGAGIEPCGRCKP